jgi:DNA polymerase-3 subunit gamma/tau
MQVQPLTLKFRPRKFSDITGQQAVRVVMSQLVRSGKIPGGVFLHGGWGAGKTSTARIFAAALNCEQEDPADRPCGGCGTCRAIVDNRSTDVTEIDAASMGRAEDMRELRQAARFAPTRRYRVFILDEVHGLSTAAFQVLLKLLEEPPPNVVMVLATTDKGKVPDTIVSRCFGLEFKRITVPDIAKRLQYIAGQEQVELSPELALAIASRSQGALRDAVMMLDQCLLVGVRTPDQLAKLLGDSDVELHLISALVRGDLPEAFVQARVGLEALPAPRDLVGRLVACLRRLLVLSSLQSAASESSVVPPAVAAELSLAASVPAARLVVALRVIWDYYRSVAPAANAFAAMDLVVVLLGEALSGKTPASRSGAISSVSSSGAAPKTSAGSASPLSVEDILASAATRPDGGG